MSIYIAYGCIEHNKILSLYHYMQDQRLATLDMKWIIDCMNTILPIRLCNMYIFIAKNIYKNQLILIEFFVKTYTTTSCIRTTKIQWKLLLAFKSQLYPKMYLTISYAITCEDENEKKKRFPQKWKNCMLVNITFPRTICVSEHTKQTHNPRNTFRRYEMFNKNNLIFQQHTGKIFVFFFFLQLLE